MQKTKLLVPKNKNLAKIGKHKDDPYPYLF